MRLVGLAFAAAVISCRREAPPPAPVQDAGPSLVVHASARSNPAMVVSAFVDVEAKGADYAIVSAEGATTAKVTFDGEGRATAALVGLRPSATSKIEIEAHAGDRTAKTSVSFETPALPPDVALPDVTMNVDDGTARGYLLGAFITPKGKVATILDRKGRTVWYRPLTGEAVGAFTRLANGNFVVFNMPARLYEEVNLAGSVVRRWVPKEPATEEGADGHEFLPLPDDRALVIGWLTSKTDSSKRFPKGSADALRRDNTAIEMSVNGDSKVIWSTSGSTLDEIQPIPEADVNQKHFEVAHMNAIDASADLYLVTCRELAQVVAIDRATGKVRWRLGGKKGDLRFVDDPLGGPSALHDARILPGNRVRIFDNGNGRKPQESRVVVYEIDSTAHTAKLVWEYRHDPAIYTWIGGSARPLPDDRLLVNFTWKGVVSEIDKDKKVRWEMSIPHSGAYRIEWIPSL